MVDTDVSPRPAGRPRGLAWFIFGAVVAVALLGGLAWLGSSAWEALHGGRDSDVHRRWIVCQYVLDGVNPYPIALAALERVHGRLGSRPEVIRIWAIPQLTPAEAAADPRVPAEALPLLAAQGPPEATYPPGGEVALTALLGWMPEANMYLIWLIGNLALLAGLAALLCRGEPPAARTPLAVAAVVALVLIWAPSQETVVVGQFSLLVTVCLLLGLRWLDRHEYAAGALLSLALLKPSLALPFMIFPLVRGRWRALAVIVVSQLAALALLSYRFGAAPWTLLHDWLGVSAYFTQAGQFTLQDVVVSLHLADTPAVLALEGGFVLFAGAWCWWNRRAPDDVLIDLLCFVAILWTYHGAYDFVLLLVPLVRRLVAAVPDGVGRPWPAAVAAALATYVCLNLATAPLIYGDEARLAFKLLRYGARLALALWFVGLAVQAALAARAATAALPAAPAFALPAGAAARSGEGSLE